MFRPGSELFCYGLDCGAFPVEFATDVGGILTGHPQSLSKEPADHLASGSMGAVSPQGRVSPAHHRDHAQGHSDAQAALAGSPAELLLLDGAFLVCGENTDCIELQVLVRSSHLLTARAALSAAPSSLNKARTSLFLPPPASSRRCHGTTACSLLMRSPRRRLHLCLSRSESN